MHNERVQKAYLHDYIDRKGIIHNSKHKKLIQFNLELTTIHTPTGRERVRKKKKDKSQKKKRNKKK